jgi:hypothetical protein
MHPLFHPNETTMDPSCPWSVHFLKEYDNVMVNFMKSGNHDSSFTKTAMVSFNHGESCSVASDSILNDDDLDDPEEDKFSVEIGVWCCFVNS